MSYFSPKAMKCYAIWHHKRAYNTIIGWVKIETVHFVVGISPDCKKSMSVRKKGAKNEENGNILDVKDHGSRLKI